MSDYEGRKYFRIDQNDAGTYVCDENYVAWLIKERGRLQAKNEQLRAICTGLLSIGKPHRASDENEWQQLAMKLESGEGA